MSQPVYVQRASGDTAYPLLQRVLVSFGTGSASTPRCRRRWTRSSRATPAPTPGRSPAPRHPRRKARLRRPRPTPPPVEEPAGDLEAAIADAQQAYEDAQAALAIGRLRGLRPRARPARRGSRPCGDALRRRRATAAIRGRRRRADDVVGTADPRRFGGTAGRPLSWRHDAGWSSSVARWAHNPEVAGSNPAPATT